MTTDKKRTIIENALGKGNDILRLEPAWVARDFSLPGRQQTRLNNLTKGKDEQDHES